ncbi:AMP-dependent synthetase/ligase [Chitinophaga cymbidii]|uniref:AMP-dependent synthetase n=1 Tax=Chitinophaga cymbidii TaxID=1096750 RepID=A0A512RTC6_9BACT|nr:long-chain fatty acid--CoA ligase [Chitinophaga cymbidii]GEP98951.1 AMP-dependent synthetase [Chitinophaga cymbidii]
MLVSKVNGAWKPYSTQEVQEIVNRLSAGLLSLGVSGNDGTAEGADKIGIISNNRPEWVFTDLAVQQTGAILVPLYPTTNPLEIKFILNDAAVKYMFVSSTELLEKIRDLQKDIPSLQHIYAFEEIPGADHWSKVTNLATDELLQRVEENKAKISEEQVATIIYTSGTTGTPKGVMLTHRNIVSNVFFSKASFPFPDAPDQKVLSFLPLNHIFEKMCTYIYLFSGISTYYAESLDKIADNLREVRPDGFTTVPRLLEKVYEKIMSKGNELTGIKRSLFFWAVALGKKYDNNISGGLWYNLQLAIANKLIFSKWREALGGRITFIVTGGAACQENLLRIFNAARVPVYEGYGPTENSPVISVNRRYPPGGTMFGTTGPVIEGVELKFTEEGEICVKGPSVMKGYFKRPDLTAETVIDGWLHTGDIGQLVNGKFLKITDRKKELFKTSGGKYVAPQPIENKCKESPFIEQLMVVGNERKFVSALIVPSFAMLKRWMSQNNIPFTTNEEAVKQPEVIAMYEKVVDRYNSTFNHVEQIKKFVLMPHEWGVETGEMTPKLSLKRKAILEKYKDEIEKIYHTEPGK